MNSKYLTILILSLCVITVAKAQEKEIWYVWVDTQVDIKGAETRVVSDEPFKITCCVRSGKYRKLVKEAKRWIKSNLSEDYRSEITLRNIQDLSFAETIISEAKRKAEAGENIKIIKYSRSCD